MDFGFLSWFSPNQFFDFYFRAVQKSSSSINFHAGWWNVNGSYVIENDFVGRVRSCADCSLGHGRECLSRPKKANSRRCNRWPWKPLIMLFDEVFPAHSPGLSSSIWRHKKSSQIMMLLIASRHVKYVSFDCTPLVSIFLAGALLPFVCLAPHRPHLTSLRVIEAIIISIYFLSSSSGQMQSKEREFFFLLA